MWGKLKKWPVGRPYMVPIFLALLAIPGYLGGAPLSSRLVLLLAIGASAAWAVWELRAGGDALGEKIRRLQWPALLLGLPLLFALFQVIIGPAGIPEVGKNWSDTGFFGGTLAPSTVSFHFVSLLSLAVVGFLAYLAASDGKPARRTMWLVTGAIAIWGAVGAGAYYLGIEFGSLIPAIDRPTYRFLSGTFANRGHFGAFAAAGVVLAAALLAERFEADRRRYMDEKAHNGIARFPVKLEAILLALAIVLLTVVVLETAARGAVLAMVMGLGVVGGVLGLRGRGRERWVRFVTVGVMAVVLVPLVWFTAGESLQSRMPYSGIVSDFSDTRLALWKPGFAALAERPISGWGLGTYEQAARIFAQEDLGLRIDRAHNEYLDLAVGWGIPAALSWIAGLGLIGTLCVRGALVRRRFWALPLGAASVLVVFATHSLVDFPLFIPANALILAVVLGTGLAQIERTTQSDALRGD